MASDLHVIPSGYRWVVKKSGAAKASAIRDTKVEALKAAREIAINQGLSVVIHGKDGKIQKTITPQDTNDSDCFITTACIKYYNLEDDCYELQTLRHFRDTYLLKSSKNKELVYQYYSIAPILVDLIESDINKENLFKEIFIKIRQACFFIDNSELGKAKETYTQVIKQLLSHFKII